MDKIHTLKDDLPDAPPDEQPAPGQQPAPAANGDGVYAGQPYLELEPRAEDDSEQEVDIMAQMMQMDLQDDTDLSDLDSTEAPADVVAKIHAVTQESEVRRAPSREASSPAEPVEDEGRQRPRSRSEEKPRRPSQPMEEDFDIEHIEDAWTSAVHKRDLQKGDLVELGDDHTYAGRRGEITSVVRNCGTTAYAIILDDGTPTSALPHELARTVGARPDGHGHHRDPPLEPPYQQSSRLQSRPRDSPPTSLSPVQRALQLAKQRNLVGSSWKQLMQDCAESGGPSGFIAAIADEHLRRMLSSVDLLETESKYFGILTLAIDYFTQVAKYNLGSTDSLDEVRRIGAWHRNVPEISEKHLHTLGATFHNYLSGHFEDEWTSSLSQAWQAFLSVISMEFLEGYQNGAETPDVTVFDSWIAKNGLHRLNNDMLQGPARKPAPSAQLQNDPSLVIDHRGDGIQHFRDEHRGNDSDDNISVLSDAPPDAKRERGTPHYGETFYTPPTHYHTLPMGLGASASTHARLAMYGNLPTLEMPELPRGRAKEQHPKALSAAQSAAAAARVSTTTPRVPTPQLDHYPGVILVGLPPQLTDNDQFLLDLNEAVLNSGAKHIDVHDSNDLEITFQHPITIDDMMRILNDLKKWCKAQEPSVDTKRLTAKPVRHKHRRLTAQQDEVIDRRRTEQLQGRDLEGLNFEELADLELTISQALQSVHRRQYELVMAWTEEDVLNWLGFNETIHRHHARSFKEMGVDGQMLLELDDPTLEQDLGIKSRLQRKRVLDEITKLKRLREVLEAS